MTDDLYQRAKAVALLALDVEPSKRAAILEAACGDDAMLRNEAEGVVAAADRAGSFLEVPAVRRCGECDRVFRPEQRYCDRDGQALVEDFEARVGAYLDGRYQIEAFLGEGGMGAVYRARHLLIDDRVAIKILRSEFAYDAVYLERFRREGQAARRLRHPNLVSVYDLHAPPGGPVYLVLEYVEGRNLRDQLVARGPYSPAEALEIAAPIASALDAAHEAGVVHRDVKPENVVVGRDVKLLDLGIARVAVCDGATRDERLTRAGALLGTPRYMAPEQWGEAQRDGEDELDGRVDVYALGVTIFELIAGRPPFLGRAVSPLRSAHVSTPPPALSDVRTNVPPAFAAALARALAKDRGDRPSRTGELVADLRAALEVDLQRALETTGERTPPPNSPAADVDEPSPDSHDAAPRTRARYLRRFVLAAALLASSITGIALVVTHELSAGGERAPGPTPRLAERTRVLATVEVARYWIELAEISGSRRVDGVKPLGAHASFRFVFAPTEAGRFALVGPGLAERATLFLAADDRSRADAVTPLVFPEGGAWINSAGDTAADRFTVVFVPDGVLVPEFLARANGTRLSPDDARALEALRSGRTPVTASAAGGPIEPAAVIVSAASARAPLAVDVTVEY